MSLSRSRDRSPYAVHLGVIKAMRQAGGRADVPEGSTGPTHFGVFLEAEMGRHDAPEPREDDRDDDNGKDDSKDTSRHSVEDDKQTATVPDPDDYK